MKKILSLILILVTAFSAVSCVKLGGDPVDKRYYRLAPVRQGETQAPQSDIILRVRRMSVSDLYNTRELVYQMEGGRIESDFYNLFFVAPSNNITTELRKWLASSGQFSNIIEPGSMVVPTLTLEGVLNSLYGDYSSGQPAAVVEMQFFLVNESTADNDIVFSQSYRQRIPLAKPDPQDLVQAMTKGVAAIFTQLEQDLAQAPI
ncbi:ABC-type transport auxiliary lipoprotein family protein [Pseudodesulfovibrio sp. zrk46]|uniref:ABC-type transport auxiliary lipoprotein family protein n=1 Tax=Pseudodesulfovibrio sp. zrk46 TaxID=2725288 RepID=UPI001448EE8A|nr:ABC-type transport auxiliary lipoprotein family protein [Pseudodesulfovibrio sp. zrk46]QJB58140.1 hypothetical protein HFN16_17885 [Pseudodesulfovibrio sp. zrk46]